MTNTIIVYKNCPVCGKEQRKEFPVEGWAKYMKGEPVQNCFPELSADDREFLISGICPTCWDLTFGGDD